MPGIMGFVRAPGGRLAHIVGDVAGVARSLCHEPGDEVVESEREDDRHVVVIRPGISSGIASIGRLADLGVHVAWWGDFYGVDRNPEAMARQIGEAYRRDGVDFARSLDGSFVLYLHDERTRRTLLITDPYASRPLFHWQDGTSLVFAPELKAFPRLLEQRLAINRRAAASFLVNGHLLADDSILEAVKPLAAGSSLCIDADGISVRRYWTHALRPSDEDAGEDHYIGLLSKLLIQAVERRVRDPRGIVVPISGGYDSRALLACLRRITDGPIQTVSWGTDDVTDDADASIGRRVATRLAAEHVFLQRHPDRLADDVSAMFDRTDGLTDDVTLHHGELGLMQRIRYDLGGEYLIRGDECFGFGGPAATDHEALRRVAIYDLARVPAALAVVNPGVRDEFVELSARTIEAVRAGSTAVDPLDRKDDFYFAQRLFHYLNRSSYYKYTVLELQNPLLDRRILEFVATLPRHYRVDKLLFRRTVARMFPELSDIPYANRHSLEDWDRTLADSTPLRRFVVQELLGRENGLDEWMDRSAVKHGIESMGSASMSQAGPRVADVARGVLARAPWAYRIAKRILSPRLAVREIPRSVILLRLVVLRRWYDAFG